MPNTHFAAPKHKPNAAASSASSYYTAPLYQRS